MSSTTKPGGLSANDKIQRFAAPSRPLSPLPSHALFNDKTRCFVYGLQPRAVQGMLDFDFICKRKTPSVAGIIYTFGGQFVSKMYWGTSETLLPVYQEVPKAIAKHPDVDTVVNFASSRSVYSSTMELMEFPQVKTIAIIAEGVPERRAREIAHKAAKKGITIIGPATVGGIKPGCFKIGNTGGMMDNIVASKLYRKGSVGYVSKSGGMSNELNNIISNNTDGVYEGVAIGGDRYPGTTFIDHLLRYQADPECKVLVLLGEVGGVEEYKVIKAVEEGVITKPIVAWAIGTCASMFKTEVQFGHAGAFANSTLETAKTKNEKMKEAGFHVPDTFEDMPNVLKQVYDKLLVKEYVKAKFPSSKLLDYALAVESVTTSKKDNLILNVDGCIAVCFVDLVRNCGAFSAEEAEDYLKMGVLNGLFVLGRSIGLIAHYLDQKRLRTGLYRHPWDDITYILPQLGGGAPGAEGRVEVQM
ncbi:hypothetical protein BN1708_009717 [Verticillium longisporum]|uniref:ATP citrate synthase n=1 Tax=Verticillium longisporum TaxID=100787 RepID=A0A0G4KJL5_VERLO|nr:hypothetical protein BN1708_009717 [Verticillium longisporum]